MVPQAFFEQVPIDRLPGDGALSRRDDHLTVCRSHAACCIETGYTRFQAGIHDDLSLRIDRGSNVFSQGSVIDVASGREGCIELHRVALLEGQVSKMPLVMFHHADSILTNRDLILLQPSGVIRIPCGHLAVGRNHYAR